MEAVALEALANREPSRLSWSIGELGFAKNRRTEGGPVDHSLPCMQITSLDGTLRRRMGKLRLPLHDVGRHR